MCDQRARRFDREPMMRVSTHRIVSNVYKLYIFAVHTEVGALFLRHTWFTPRVPKKGQLTPSTWYISTSSAVQQYGKLATASSITGIEAF